MKRKLDEVIPHLNAIAEILETEVPIVYLPFIAARDPLKGKMCAFIIRQQELKEELEEIYEVKL